MRLFGLLGFPLTHSFSQKYFTEKFTSIGMADAEYRNFSIPDISELHQILKADNGLCGFNITIPYKKQVTQFLHESTDAVKTMGACNCVHIKNGRLIGYNTDIVGFEQSLKPFLKPHHTKALILGTGGAAAAVQYVLRKLNIAYTNVSRNNGENCIPYSLLNQSLMEQHSLIINTTPVGQYPTIEASPAIPYEFITEAHHLFDLIYNPTETSFLQRGSAQGATTQNGYEMLVLQAEESWRIWNQA
ncbi:MAG: shikimate dehydrogenase [Sphingobacteriia bacterium]|nr:MAG: shikimate dehydrogenase [Sphingobacteriia bacterium]